MQTLSPSHSASITNWSSITVTLHRSNLSKGFQKNVVPNLVKMYRMSSKWFFCKSCICLFTVELLHRFCSKFSIKRTSLTNIYIWKNKKIKIRKKHFIYCLSSFPQYLKIFVYKNISKEVSSLKLLWLWTHQTWAGSCLRIQ